MGCPISPCRTLRCTQVGKRCCVLAVELESVTPAVRTEVGETQSPEPRAGGGGAGGCGTECQTWQCDRRLSWGREDGGVWSQARAAPQEMSNLSSVCKLEFRVRFKGKQSLLERQDQISGQILGQLGKKSLLGGLKASEAKAIFSFPLLRISTSFGLKGTDNQNWYL